MYVVGMKTEHNLEELLEAAGFDFVVVERCPDPDCELCASPDLPVAA